MWRTRCSRVCDFSGAGGLTSVHVAVVFDNLGPYHVARLNASAALMQITAIEISGKSSEYDWVSPVEGIGFGRRTLFGRTEADGKSGADIARAVDAALDATKPDVVALPGWSHRAALAGLRWARRHRVPALLMSASNEFDHHRQGYREWIKRRIVSLYSGGLAGGTRAADYLQALGIPRNRIEVGYDTVDNDHFARGADAARAEAAALRPELGLPERYLISCTRFVTKKNLPFLIDAYAEYRRRAGDGAIDLVLMGDGALRPALEAQVAELGLNGSVHFPGFVQYGELPAYYGLAHAFVLASRIEQWGLVVNEAMASGLPVLVSNRCGCALDLVEEGANGFVFDPWDQAGLVEGLARIAAASPSMAEHSRTVIARWTPGHFARALKSLAEAVRAEPIRGSRLLGNAAIRILSR